MSYNHCDGHASSIRASDRDLVIMTEVSGDDTAHSFQGYDGGSLSRSTSSFTLSSKNRPASNRDPSFFSKIV